MDTYELLATFRGVERMIIELGGIAAMVMGTLLYRWGIKGPQDVEASGAGFTFKLGNAAPGSVLALFGMWILLNGLSHPLQISFPASPPAAPGAQPAAPREAPAPAPDAPAASGDAGRSGETTPATEQPGQPPAGSGGGTVIVYAALPDRVREEIDSFDATHFDSLTPERARAILASHRAKAAQLLSSGTVPRDVRPWLTQVHNAPDAGDPVATLNQLATSARKMKMALSGPAR